MNNTIKIFIRRKECTKTVHLFVRLTLVEVKVMSLFLTKIYAMKAHGRVDV
jgi:hypothetical protein